MEPLSKALGNIQPISQEQPHPQLTPLPGLISSDGKLTTNPSPQSRLEQSPSQASSTSSREQFEPQQVKDEKIAELIAMAWGIFPTYGDDGSTLPLKIKVFQRALHDYPFCVISPAFDKFFKSGKQFPLPADIINIIEPPKKEVSAAAYVAIKKRQAQGEYIWHDDERNLLKAYENQEHEKVRGGSEDLKEAQRQIEAYKLSITHEE